MARSRKRTPICGNTTATSEKYDKRMAHRRLRKAVREGQWHLRLRDVSDTWTFAKDGRQWFDATQRPDLLRK